MTASLVQVHGYFNTGTGEFKHRLLWPGEALARTGAWQVHNLHLYDATLTDAALAADLVVLHFLGQPEVERLVRLRANAHKPTVYEIPDNFLSLGSFADGHDTLRDPVARQNCFRYARACDAVQFTTSELAERFGFLNPRRAVFANQLPTAPPPVRARTGRFVFGWGGSHSHADDLAYMAGAVHAFCAAHPDAVFSYMGDRGPFDTHFAGLPEAQKRFRPFGPMEAYEAFIETLHVGIAVVAPDGFNACRSDCKLLEYARGGAAPLLSDHPIYRPHGAAGHARLFADGAALEAALEALYRDEGARAALAAAAHAYSAGRVHDAHVGARHALYSDLVGAQTHTPLTLPPPDTDGPATVLALAPRMAAGEHARVREELAGLLERVPDHPYAQFCIMKTLYLQGTANRQALLRDWPVARLPLLYRDRALELLSLAANDLGRAAEAATLREAIEDPVRRGWLGDEEARDPVRFYRAQLAENPYELAALTRLAELLAARRHVGAEAESLAVRACLILPESQALQDLLRRIRAARMRPKQRPKA